MKFTEKRLKELGFQRVYWTSRTNYDYENGAVLLSRSGNEYTISIYASITSSSDYQRQCLGIKTEQDLIDLVRLVNGLSK